MIRLARQFSSAQLAQRTVNVVGGVEYKCDSITNVPSRILEKIDCKLYCVPKNPIHTIRLLIEQHFKKSSSQFQFKTIDSPAVSIQNNFDLLLIPKDHVSRSPHDTYYLNSDHVLRTQTSAHQVQLLREGNLKFLLTADVYRRDEIDSSHYPVFHQMEGVNVVAKNSLTTNLNHKGYHPTPENPIQIAHSNKEDILLVDNLLFDLRKSLEEMVESLFSKEIKVRWVPAYFPFTSPSFEMEIFYRGEWMEVLGCGIIQDQILKNSGLNNHVGWAFGLGLERLAMILFDIPDIRLFWSKDDRFISQFEVGKVSKFQPFSKFPATYKDMSFWIPVNKNSTMNPFHENTLCDIIRDVAGDMVENVKLVDQFKHPKTGMESKCYRIMYRSMDRTLSNKEVDEIQQRVCDAVVERMGLKLR